MLLAIDVGNTQTVVGVYQEKRLLHQWRVATNKQHTSDELRVKLAPLLLSEGIATQHLEGVALASVVPQLTQAWCAAVERMTGSEALVCSAEAAGGLFSTEYANPAEIGADRVADAVAAKALYGAPVVVVDFGTATNIEVIDAEGRFVGGVIAPGIKGSLDSLVNGTAKLPRVEIEAPRSIIAKNTVTNMQAGIVFGFAGLVEYIVRRIKKELHAERVITVATGGFSDVIAREISCIDTVDKLLTLNGLKYLYYLNSSEEK